MIQSERVYWANKKFREVVLMHYINQENVDQMYENLKRMVVRRKHEFNAFIEFLENETTWLISPASTKYHLAVEKGLLIHSVGVAYNLMEIKKVMLPQIDDEVCIIIGLFHDVGKLGLPNKPLYLKNENGYHYNPDSVSMGLAVRSLYLISKFLKLTDDEAQAIAYHDGQYIDENKIVAHRESPLTLLAHYADYWTAHIYENDSMRKKVTEEDSWSVLQNRGERRLG